MICWTFIIDLNQSIHFKMAMDVLEDFCCSKSAYGMVAYAGMSDRLPNICYYNNQEYQFQRPYSETTAKVIDDEVLKMINGEYARAKQILTEHKDGHRQLAELLYKNEVIFAEDVEKIFGKRPWISRAQALIKENEKDAPKLEDMPEEVKRAQAEHEAEMARRQQAGEQTGTPSTGEGVNMASTDESNQNA